MSNNITDKVQLTLIAMIKLPEHILDFFLEQCIKIIGQ